MIDIGQIGEHVSDGAAFHIPVGLWELLPPSMHGPHPHPGSVPLPSIAGLQLTRFMVLEVVAALLMIAVFVPLARRIATGKAPRGLFWNFFEAILVFIRDRVARPAIGQREAEPFLPFLWNVFFFILFCNLLGMVPWAGSPTGALGVTGALALVTFGMVVGTGVARHGFAGYFVGMVPQVEVPFLLAVALRPGIFLIEVLGLLIKHLVLAVRLLANMFAGHMVLAVIVSFITASAKTFLLLWLGVTFASVLGATALSLLELFVAFLQAYIFTFLSALFIGMSVHQH